MKPGIRIIGGRWRGRKLPVTDQEGLRPTPDRIRETLFNWLAEECRGARVLDCCAGSGALGIEALSRGALSLTALEQAPAVAGRLRRVAAGLPGDAIEIVEGDAVTSIDGLQGRFDLVFIDPPYAKPGLRERIWHALESRGLVGEGARVYFEWPAGENFELPAAGLHWLKRKRAGQVNYAIAEWRPSG